MKTTKSNQNAMQTAKDEAAYKATREEAQKKANELGFDYGISKHAFGYSCFMLPKQEHRRGHELTCEVVSPMTRPAQKGHGEPLRYCGMVGCNCSLIH
jgi:hypothetical protein